MKIIALQAENVKKLVAVEIRPDGALVQITGKNGQGKTSVLDSIWWALCGAANIQGNPIRQGENQARIRLDLGEIVVTRTFKKGEAGNTVSSITVENAEGTAIRQPQTMLDRLLGELSFDPLAFARATKKEQFEQLKRFVPGVDFEAIERAHQEDYDKRTNVNREAATKRTLAEDIFITTPEGTKPISEASLVDELENAGKHNADIETRKANRQSYETASVNQKAEAKDCRGQAEQLIKRAERLEAQAKVCDERLAGATALPEPIDTQAIKRRLESAKEVNKAIGELARKADLIKEAEQLENDSEVITQRMNARTTEKQKKITEAKLPVEGLGFGDGEILLRGVPFNQASDAEQLQVSIAMAMALNPKLRVIRVRDGSLLDEDSLKLLEQMAENQDYQVWIERVDTTGKVGFVLENGHVKQEVLA